MWKKERKKNNGGTASGKGKQSTAYLNFLETCTCRGIHYKYNSPNQTV